MNIQKFNNPWTYWLIDDFLSADCLRELKSVPCKFKQITPGRRVGSERLFVDDAVQHQYPHLHALWRDLHSGTTAEFFTGLTDVDYSSLHPRMEVVSDYGDFYLEPHHDHLEKRLTVMVYTDHEKLYPGTEIVGHGAVESRDNRAFVFVPSAETYHAYPPTHFDSVRRALMINYWTYTL